MAVPFFLSVPLLLLLCQHGSGSPCSPENPYTDEGLPCAEVDALKAIIVNLGLPEPLTSRNYCSQTDDRSISFECGCNESTTNSRHITSLVTNGIRLSGQIDERLSELTYLNKMYVGPIPKELGNLLNLNILSLSENRLSGPLPQELGNLSKLAHLLTGRLPESFANLTSLHGFTVSGNKLSGQIPPFIAKFTNLISLCPELAMNEENQQIKSPQEPSADEAVPTLPMDALKAIIVNLGLPEPLTSRNYCSQTDDRSISFECGCNESTTNSRHITSLVTNGIRLSGQIDERLSELTHLNKMYVATYLFDGLNYLNSDLSDNQLHGTIPESLGKLNRLKFLNLESNQLSGQIPPTLGNLEALETLVLSMNFLNDSIPQSLGSLKNLTTLSLSQNRLSGPLPRELGNLSKLEDLSLYSNNLTGRLPDSFVNLKSLLSFIVSGNKLSGEIPPFIANFTNLTYLYLMGNDFKGELPPAIFNLSRLRILLVSDLNTSFSFPEIGNLTNINSLVLRNCSLTGGIPDYIGNNWKSLYYLDLSFNNLNGSIPQSLKNAPFLNRLLLTNNKLTGSIPPGILKRDKVDLSYNNFTGFIKDNITDPTKHNSTKVKTLDPGKPNMDSILALSKKCTSKHHSLFINCGGARTNTEGNPYDEDVSTETFFSVPGTWAYSCSGDLTFTTCNSSDFGERKLKDLNIIEMAKGPNEAWKTNFTAIVDDNNPLEIHFFWAGKGSLYNPPALIGPLVSAISVTPNFDVNDGKLSASQIAGITIGCAFAPLLLFLFAWQMGLLGNRELREIQIKVQNRPFTLQQIIDGTKNFSSKMEIGRGRFGVIYKANLPDQIKLAMKKISPPSEQREKDELKSEIGNLTSLSHENLVQLFGGYSNKDLHLLIYEYMETGSLQKALFGIAKGLNYLHEEEEKSIKIKIVHGNVNAKNILLDKTHTAKLSDFGLATIYNEEDPFTAIKARGSRVYMAPEHALGKAITVKADVYSYGVVVLEIVSGRSNTEYIPNQEADFLLDDRINLVVLVCFVPTDVTSFGT
ncbi:hypothetical protein DKX38_023310 [Salix brachista]|uniref:Protein kinase domain-containing protein n=1 Tax=Salix brachista TaxID=2182728 RepID=A0A5N5JIM8_9ROSI|nr:hypothetical protein DKX38_023310 [Salix brachista]